MNKRRKRIKIFGGLAILVTAVAWSAYQLEVVDIWFGRP